MHTENAARFDIYRCIHKALRAFMSDTLALVGRMDGNDETDVAVTLEQTRSLLAILAVHVDDENRFVHSAMEAREPGSVNRTARDHVEHECALSELKGKVEAVQQSAGQARAFASHELYRRLAVFVAENYEHMNVEERENNAVLWAHYTDEEILAIEAALVASLPPDAVAVAMRWMIPAINHSERVEMLQAMRQGAPAEMFEGMLAIARGHLSARDWAKLEKALALPSTRAA